MANFKKNVMFRNKRAVSGATKFIVSVIAIVFVTYLMTGFVVNLLQVRNPTSPVLSPVEGSDFSLNSSYNTLENSFDDIIISINSSKNELGNAKPSPLEYVFVIIKETATIPITMFIGAINILASFSNIFLGVFLSQLGLPDAIVLGVNLLFSVLILIGIFVTIKFIRSGQD
jgi:hypothetical protein